MTSPAGRLLVDTHVLLWWLAGDPSLPAEIGERIDTELDVFVSPASIWEIEIKRAAGKLKAPDDLVEVVETSGVSELPVRYRHAELAGRLPLVHRDPLDRLLVAQAVCERLTLVTRDADISRYDVPVLSF